MKKNDTVMLKVDVTLRFKQDGDFITIEKGTIGTITSIKKIQSNLPYKDKRYSVKVEITPKININVEVSKHMIRKIS